MGRTRCGYWEQNATAGRAMPYWRARFIVPTASISAVHKVGGQFGDGVEKGRKGTFGCAIEWRMGGHVVFEHAIAIKIGMRFRASNM